MTFTLEFVHTIEDRSAFLDLLCDYYRAVLPLAEAAGVPRLSPQEVAAGAMEDMSDVLPPRGRTLIAHDGAGRMVGCGMLRRIREDAVEMKRMFVRPEAQGTGLGRRLFEMRIAEARAMGMAEVLADTVRGNRAMLNMYEKLGFEYIARYPENANPPEYAPALVYLRLRLSG